MPTAEKLVDVQAAIEICSKLEQPKKQKVFLSLLGIGSKIINYSQYILTVYILQQKK